MNEERRDPLPALMPRLGLMLTMLVAGCGGSTPSPTIAIQQGGCPQDAFCFNVFAATPGPLGPVRLLVMWVRPDQEHDPSPDLVEVGSLTGQERSIVIRRSTLRPPSKIGSFGVTWGYLFAVPTNASSKLTPKDAVGLGQMMFTDAKPEATHLPTGPTYPAGLAPGVAAYRMARVNGSTHDKFFLAPAGAVFDLVLCPVVEPQCRLPAPNPN